MSKDQEIRELFKRHNVPLDRDDVWAVQGTPVVKHKAVERLGAALGIEWMPPQILRAERDEAVILATGKVGDKLEWSIGEALIVKDGFPGGNYKVSGKQAAYPFAMSEKRARDRVILKLAGLQGVYSEEEADDFKQRAPEPSNRYPEPNGKPQRPLPEDETTRLPRPGKDSRSVYVDNALERIQSFQNLNELNEWLDVDAEQVWPDFGITQHDPDGSKILMACKKRRLELKQPRAA